MADFGLAICHGDAGLEDASGARGTTGALFVPCWICCFLRSFCEGLNEPEVFRSLVGVAERPREMLDVRVVEACAMISCSPSFDDASGAAPQGRDGASEEEVAVEGSIRGVVCTGVRVLKGDDSGSCATFHEFV
jgi:hypothetical protein